MPILLVDTNSPAIRKNSRNRRPTMMDVTDYPNWCMCPVSNEVMDDPVIVDAPCHHTVNRRTLIKWGNTQSLKQQPATCPVCSTPLRSETLSSPNVPLREAIHEFFRCSHNRTQRKISLHHWTSVQKKLGVHRCALHPDQPSHECLHCIWKDYNIHEHDTIKGIIRTLRQHPTDTKIIEQGYTVLANRLAAKEVGVQSELTQRFFLEFLLNSMKEHTSVSSNLIFQAFRILRHLPFWNEEHAESIVKEGGVSLMLEILKSNPPRVQRYACWFLYGLCLHHAAATKEILTNDGLRIVENVISSNTNGTEEEKKKELEDLKFEAKRLQTKLSEQPKTRGQGAANFLKNYLRQ